MDDEIRISAEEAEDLVAFIKLHERQDIPEAVWEICMKLYDALEEVW